jgi:hypothetical protein
VIGHGTWSLQVAPAVSPPPVAACTLPHEARLHRISTKQKNELIALSSPDFSARNIVKVLVIQRN